MKKKLIYILGAIAGLVLILFFLKFIFQAKYTSRLPVIPESHALTREVSLQIAEASKNVKRHPSAAHLGGLGMVYHSSANYEEAAVCYKLAIERDAEQWIWSYYLGFLMMEMGDSEAVIENFNHVIESFPQNYHAWYYGGEGYLKLRSYDLAEKYFKEISEVPRAASGKETTRVDHFPLGLQAKYQLARIYFDSGRLEQADLTLREILKTNPRFGPAYRLMGNIYRSGGDEITGAEYYARANDLMSHTSPVDTLIDQLALLSRSELYLQKKIDEAINGIYSQWALRLINHALLYIPDSKHLLSKAIKTCLWLDLDQEAMSYTDRHLKLIHKDFNELIKTGLSFYKKEIYVVSTGYFLGALNLSPGDKEIQKRIAIGYWNTGEQQKSLDLLDEILRNNPDNLEVLAEVTEALIFNLNQEEMAASYLRILKQEIPSNPLVQKMMAHEAERMGQTDRAISLYSASFNGNPEDLETIKRLGSILTAKKMWTESIGLFREALVYHANEPYILERLGSLLLVCPDPSLKNIPEGRFLLERAFVHTSGKVQTRISAGRNLALACALLGDKQNANRFISMTISMAKRENAPQSYLADLEGLAAQFSQMSDNTVILTQ